MSIAIELPPELAEPYRELSRDIRDASQQMGRRDGRFLVDLYYQIQDNRIRCAAQRRTSEEEAEPNRLIDWAFESMRIFERVIQSALGRFAKSYRVGQWCQAQCGVGPVLSAAMLSHLDIRKAPSAGHFWSFAGLSPGVAWEKGKKRPWNADLKAICAFKMGECFVRTCSNKNSYYGKLYSERKAEMIAKNDAGGFAEDAAKEIARCEAIKGMMKKMEGTERMKAWVQGKLSKQHIHDRARRVAVKLFLSHLHSVMHEDFHGTAPPNPYVLEHMGHVDYIAPPLWPGDYDGRPLSELLND